MASSWKEALQDRLPEKLAHEIDIFEAQIELKKMGKLEDKVFAETRLRRGAYGQRYDNGQRHDGVAARKLAFPREWTKGPETLWDAPGMQRIKLPYGGMSPEQMDVLADLADEYADSICHITTRQDIQLHFVHIEDTPDLMRRLAAVNITTREACGNSVRNVTGCPIAGVCHDEAFDISPYAKALMEFFLGHPDVQDFGRKFKPAFSGCAQHACGLVNMHDGGYVAKIRDGRRGFAFYVGGGLGAVPHDAQLLSDFVPEEELLPLSQAVARVYARLGEKRNRNRARIKFLVAKLGIDEFRRLVTEERKTLPHDDRWTAYLKDLPHHQYQPARDAVPLRLKIGDAPEGYDDWAATNVYAQKQTGYATVTVTLPLGDLTSDQMRRLSNVARRYVGDNVRTTVEQNIVLRFVSQADLPAVYAELKKIGLGQPGAGSIVDVVSCPGTDTCKLGIASSRGLGGELRQRLLDKRRELPQEVRDLRIKVSGCMNSCGQHHVADLGFYGNSRKVGNYTVPHFQVVLGGQWTNNAGSYGLALGSVPSKAIPQLVDALTGRFVKERQAAESFQAFITRLGKKEIKAMLEPFAKVPAFSENPDYYTDWGDPRSFTIGDMGTGECAGEVISLFAFEIARAESEAFEASLALDEKDWKKADDMAYRAMVRAAKALVWPQNPDVGEEPGHIVAEFRKRFHDTQLFFDRFTGGKYAEFLFLRHEQPNPSPTGDQARRLVEETQLFIEACHACDQRLAATKPAPAPASAEAKA
jgi:sulfite reductase (ferredoxin)